MQSSLTCQSKKHGDFSALQITSQHQDQDQQCTLCTWLVQRLDTNSFSTLPVSVPQLLTHVSPGGHCSKSRHLQQLQETALQRLREARSRFLSNSHVVGKGGAIFRLTSDPLYHQLAGPCYAIIILQAQACILLLFHLPACGSWWAMPSMFGRNVHVTYSGRC